APASTITMPSLLPATMRSSVLRLRWSKVGLMTKSPSTWPTRTPAIVRVCGDHERDDLRLVAPSGREQRADRAIDEPACEHFLLGRLAFTLEESAGDA